MICALFPYSPSDSGSQPNEPPSQLPVVTAITTTSQAEPPVIAQMVPESPVPIKKEQNEIAAVTTAGTPVTIQGPSSMAVATTSSSTAEKPATVPVALPDGASPRKKPRKQNV